MWGFYKDLKYFWTFSEELRLFQGLRGFLNRFLSKIEAFSKCCEAHSAISLWYHYKTYCRGGFLAPVRRWILKCQPILNFS
jgi:hypothetical protein